MGTSTVKGLNIDHNIIRMNDILLYITSNTVWKVSKYGVFSSPYFPAFGLNTERYGVSLRIQSECGKIRTRKNSVFRHFSRCEILPEKGSLGTHFFILKYDCYFEPSGYVMGGWAVLELSSILFIKSELHCGRIASWCNSEILFHKISDNQILRSLNLICIRLALNYQTTLVPFPEKVAPLKALIYDIIFVR